MAKGAMSPVRARNTKVKRANVQSRRVGATKGSSGEHGSGYGKNR